MNDRTRVSRIRKLLNVLPLTQTDVFVQVREYEKLLKNISDVLKCRLQTRTKRKTNCDGYRNVGALIDQGT